MPASLREQALEAVRDVDSSLEGIRRLFAPLAGLDCEVAWAETEPTVCIWVCDFAEDEGFVNRLLRRSGWEAVIVREDLHLLVARPYGSGDTVESAIPNSRYPRGEPIEFCRSCHIYEVPASGTVCENCQALGLKENQSM